MARITPREAQGWAEGTKFAVNDPFQTQDNDLLDQIEEEVIARVSNAYDTSSWTDENSTPRLVRVAIAKLFVAWSYRRAYSESITEEDAIYAAKLEQNAETIIQGILDGSIEVPDEPPSATSTPLFYPTDASSALEPTRDDMSLGPAKFSMGMSF